MTVTPKPASSVLEVLDLLALHLDLGHRLDADLQVQIGETLGHPAIGLLGLDPFGQEGRIGNEQKRSARDCVRVADDEDRRRARLPDARRPRRAGARRR